MSEKIPMVFCWSGGKDSSYALYQLLQGGTYQIRYLLSTFSGVYHRLSMHGIREELIEEQARQIGIPLIKVYVYEASNAEYEQQMGATLKKLKEEGIVTAGYGDIFLEDLRKFREEKMNQLGMQCVFPLWKKDTRQLVDDFITTGFQTYTCCINDGYLSNDFCGKLIDASFIASLPDQVDPCGENGEFHSFCVAGPIFKSAIPIQIGDLTYKEIPMTTEKDHPSPATDVGTMGFWYSDIGLIKPAE